MLPRSMCSWSFTLTGLPWELFFLSSNSWILAVKPHGDPQMGHILGLAYVKMEDYAQAQKLFMHGTEESVDALGVALFEASSKSGNKEDVGLLITEAVLRYAAAANIRNANKVFEVYAGRWYMRNPALLDSKVHTIPSALTPPGSARSSMNMCTVAARMSTVPLFNFCQFLPMIIQRESGQLFLTLKEHYLEDLKKNPVLPMVCGLLALSRPCDS